MLSPMPVGMTEGSHLPRTSIRLQGRISVQLSRRFRPSSGKSGLEFDPVDLLVAQQGHEGRGHFVLGEMGDDAPQDQLASVRWALPSGRPLSISSRGEQALVWGPGFLHLPSQSPAQSFLASDRISVETPGTGTEERKGSEENLKTDDRHSCNSFAPFAILRSNNLGASQIGPLAHWKVGCRSFAFPPFPLVHIVESSHTRFSCRSNRLPFSHEHKCERSP
jgi:hypothetical protein